MSLFTVYKHISPDGKVYIGITCQKPEERWKKGKGYKNNPYLTNAIHKHGWDNFKHEILYEGLTEEQAKAIEVDLIKLHHATNRKCGYNITDGGDCSSGMKGKHHSEETRAKMSASHSGFKHTKESRARMSEAQKGREINEKQKKAVSEARSMPVMCIETGVIYHNAHDVKRFLGINPSNIYESCKGIGYRKTAGGFHWKRVAISEG